MNTDELDLTELDLNRTTDSDAVAAMTTRETLTSTENIMRRADSWNCRKVVTNLARHEGAREEARLAATTQVSQK